MGWLGALFTNKARKAAVELKLIVSEVNRDLPVFSRNNQFKSLTSGRCVRYALPRTSGTNWELLQRGAKQSAQLPNGYLLKSSDTSPQLLDKIRPIAEEFSEEYFEFEGTDSEVAIFWEEWGGANQVARLHKALLFLQGI